MRGFWNVVSRRKFQVAVFGASGTGKTTFGALLHGNDPASDQPFKASVGVETYKVNTIARSRLVIVPGSYELYEYHWHEQLRLIAQGKTRFVINAVCYGLHDFREEQIQDHRLYQHGMTKKEFLNAYAENRRHQELRLLRKIEKAIKQSPRPVRMVTVVTKQDLWWASRKDVAAHYQDGEYGRAIRRLSRVLGPRKFSHEIVSASLVRKNFRSQSGANLVLTARGYDDGIRQRNIVHLTECLKELSTT